MASAPVRVVVGAGLNRDGEATMLRLAHPATGAEALFLLTPGHELLELNFVKNEHTSWFVGDAVAEDGGLYTATAVDALFLLLPHLEQARQASAAGEGRFNSLEVLLEGGLERLQPLAAALLPAVCAVRESDDECFYRLDDARALAWLSAKAARCADALKSGAAAGGAFEALGDDAIASYAVELLGEYLSAAWLCRLRDYIGVVAAPMEPVAPLPQAMVTERGGEGDAEHAEKKAKLSVAQKASITRVASNQAKNAKAAVGSKPLSSFFTSPK